MIWHDPTHFPANLLKCTSLLTILYLILYACVGGCGLGGSAHCSLIGRSAVQSPVSVAVRKKVLTCVLLCFTFKIYTHWPLHQLRCVSAGWSRVFPEFKKVLETFLGDF